MKEVQVQNIDCTTRLGGIYMLISEDCSYCVVYGSWICDLQYIVNINTVPAHLISLFM